MPDTGYCGCFLKFEICYALKAIKYVPGNTDQKTREKISATSRFGLIRLLFSTESELPGVGFVPITQHLWKLNGSQLLLIQTISIQECLGLF